MYAHLIAKHYKADYEAIFGPLPALGDANRFPASAGPVDEPSARRAWNAMAKDDRDSVTRIYANMGKSIAAYERKIRLGPSRFDSYAEAVGKSDGRAADSAMTPDEQAGLKLFIGRAECIKCHNGPLFTNNDFHNTGIPAAPGLPEDLGSRVPAIRRGSMPCCGAMFAHRRPRGGTPRLVGPCPWPANEAPRAGPTAERPRRKEAHGPEVADRSRSRQGRPSQSRQTGRPEEGRPLVR